MDLGKKDWKKQTKKKKIVGKNTDITEKIIDPEEMDSTSIFHMNIDRNQWVHLFVSSR